MKKHFNKLALLLAVLLVLGCLTACGASSKSEATASMSYDTAAAGTSMETMEMEMAVEEPAAAPEENGFSTTSQESGDALTVETVEDFTEKIIYTGYVSIETTAFDDSLRDLEQAVAANGGFVQDSSVEGYSRTNADGTTSVVDRWASYTVRIPADRFSAFMALTDGIGNVTSSSRSAENVTSQYTDYEARLDSLYIQEERLLDMLEQSGDLESLITLEERLSEVRYEIESIERNLRNLDQKLAYSTVHLTLQEVEIYTPTVPVTRTFGEKLSDAFSSGWNGFVRGIQNFCLGLARNLFTLVLLAVLIVVLILVLRKVRRHRRKKPEPKQEENEQK